MVKLVVSLRKKFKGLFEKVKSKFKFQKDYNQYEYLGPKDDVFIKSIDVLDYAFRDKKIKNIAVTGNYSSGKSSIIDTYIKGRKRRKTLKISLATFVNQVEIVGIKKNKSEEDVPEKQQDNIGKVDYSETRTIEKTIVEKIYYSVYKKILNQNIWFSRIISLIIYLLCFDLIWLFRKDSIFNFLVTLLSNHTSLFILELLLLVFSICFIMLFSKILFNIVHLDKFSIKLENFECEFKANSENVINDNIELLIRIFMRCRFKYVIFEDLDRFDNPIIFEHLRELNEILNKNTDVKFVYLLKDDMFKNENRTKFFDFIYTVVPYVSYGTSGDVLNEIIKKNKLENELDSLFIYQIGLFVDDIRILKNTLNEYKVYKKELEKENLDYKALFAILLYKNIFSDDFAFLQKECGTLYKIINSVDEIKRSSIDELKMKNKKLADRLEKINTEYKNNENVVKIVIMSVLKKTTLDDDIKFINNGTSFVLNKFRIGKFLEEVNLKFLCDKDTKIESYYIPLQLLRTYINDKNIETMMDEFVNGIENGKKSIQEETESNLYKIKNIENCRLKEFFPEIGDFYKLIPESDVPKNKNDRDLVNFFLSYGYIDENYKIYISKFHEGSRTKNDNEFLISLVLNKELDVDYKLDCPENVIERIPYNQYEYKSIINFDLLNELVKQGKKDKIKKFFNTLRYCNSVKRKQFLNLIAKSENKELFKYFSIYEDWFLMLEENCERDDDVVETIVEKILLNSPDTLITMHAQERLKSFIEENNLFLNNRCRNYYKEVKLCIEGLDIKYESLSNGNIALEVNNEILIYCIEKSLFKINFDNIQFIIQYYICKNDEVKIKGVANRNFSILKDCGSVFYYIDKNISEYLDNVYFKYDNFNNDESDIVYLLNKPVESISLEDKFRIIELESKNHKYKINNLEDVEDFNLYNKFLKCDFVNTTYRNLNEYFQKMIFPDEKKEESFENTELLLKCINRSGKIIDIINSSEGKRFRNFLLQKDTIKNEVYEQLVKSFNITIASTDIISKLCDKKIEILLKYDGIKYTIENFEEVRNRTDYIIESFISKKSREILDDLENITFSGKELILIINSQRIHYSFKKRVIEDLVNYDSFDFEIDDVDVILKYMIGKNYKLKFSMEQMLELIEDSENTEIKLSFVNYMFDVNFENIDKKFIEKVLVNSLMKYSKLIKNRTRPKYLYLDSLERFIKNLRKLGYNIVYKVDDNKTKIEVSGTVR